MEEGGDLQTPPPLKRSAAMWYVLDGLMDKAKEFFTELQRAKLENKGKRKRVSQKQKKKLDHW